MKVFYSGTGMESDNPEVTLPNAGIDANVMLSFAEIYYRKGQTLRRLISIGRKRVLATRRLREQGIVNERGFLTQQYLDSFPNTSTGRNARQAALLKNLCERERRANHYQMRRRKRPTFFYLTFVDVASSTPVPSANEDSRKDTS